MATNRRSIVSYTERNLVAEARDQGYDVFEVFDNDRYGRPAGWYMHRPWREREDDNELPLGPYATALDAVNHWLASQWLWLDNVPPN